LALFGIALALLLETLLALPVHLMLAGTHAVCVLLLLPLALELPLPIVFLLALPLLLQLAVALLLLLKLALPVEPLLTGSFALDILLTLPLLL
jgi:hypothetical protein